MLDLFVEGTFQRQQGALCCKQGSGFLADAEHELRLMGQTLPAPTGRASQFFVVASQEFLCAQAGNGLTLLLDLLLGLLELGCCVAKSSENVLELGLQGFGLCPLLLELVFGNL